MYIYIILSVLLCIGAVTLAIYSHYKLYRRFEDLSSEVFKHKQQVHNALDHSNKVISLNNTLIELVKNRYDDIIRLQRDVEELKHLYYKDIFEEEEGDE